MSTNTLQLSIAGGSSSSSSSMFTASLLDNPTASAFNSLLPLQLQMTDLNSNEKYADLPNALPTAATNPGQIRAGDLMLYGSRTLVLWYEDYSSSYTYTRIGSIEDPAGLAGLVGIGSITVTFDANGTENASSTVGTGTTSTAGSGTGTSSATMSSGARRNKRVSTDYSLRKACLLTGLIGLMCASLF